MKNKKIIFSLVSLISFFIFSSKTYALTLPRFSISSRSDDISVVTVDDNGKVTGISEGKTTIRATYNGESANYEINVKSKSNTDYSWIDLSTLEQIQNNQEALAQVREIKIEERNKSNIENIKNKLELIGLCPNIENIYICVNSLALDKTFFEFINSSQDVTLSIQCGSVDFEGVENTNITNLFLSETKVYNFKDIINLSKLQSITTYNVDGFEIVDFDAFTNLETLVLSGQRINNYKTFFKKIKNVKVLDLNTCNLQNSDTQYMSELLKLETLNLFGTYVTDISFLKNITTLKDVVLPLNVNSLDVLYEMPNLQCVLFDAVTELKVTPDLIEYFKNNGISYPMNYDENICKKVENLLARLNFSENASEEEKIRKITELVVDYMECKDQYQEEYQITLDQVINLKYGVCHHYSLLEYTLLTMCGIDAYLINGSAKDVFEGAEDEYDLPSPHAWNMVRLKNGKWYGIDPMWLEANDEEMQERKMNLYLLKNTKIEKNGEYPYYSNDKERVERYFALSHVTFNNPIDTLGKQPCVESITISRLPARTNYCKSEKLNTEGLVITVEYDNEDTEDITEGFECTPTDLNKAGKQTITVSYNGKEATFDVEVLAEHNWDDDNITKEATCTEKGEKTYTCTICGEKKTEDIEAIGHDYKDGVCTRCKESILVIEGNYRITGKAIRGINPNTTIDDFAKNIRSSFNVVITKDEKEITEGLIGTGMKVKVYEGQKLITEYTSVVPGDIDGNGKQTVTDLLKLKRNIIHLEQLNEYQEMAADLKNDNKINATDLLKLKRRIVGLE